MSSTDWTIIYHTADSAICPHIHKFFYEKSNPSANILYADGRKYFLPNPHAQYTAEQINKDKKLNKETLALQSFNDDIARKQLIRNHDKLLRDWLKDNFHLITTNNVACFEWDVLLNKQLPSLNIECLTSWGAWSFSSDTKWGHAKPILYYEKNVKTIVSPFGGFYSTRDFIEEMISSKYDYLYQSSIFCEARMSILAYLTNVKIKADKTIFDQECALIKPEFIKEKYQNIHEVPIGCFHPIKSAITF